MPNYVNPDYRPLEIGCTAFSVTSIDEAFGNEGYLVQQKRAAAYEFYITLFGRAEFCTEGQTIPVKDKDIVFVKDNSAYLLRFEKNTPFHCFYLALAFKDNSGRLENIISTLRALPSMVFADRSGTIYTLNRLITELNYKDDYRDVMLESQLNQLLVNLFRSMEGKSTDSYAGNGIAAGNSIVESVRNYIDANLTSIRKLSDLASKIGYCYPYMSNVFKAEMGISIKDYHNQKIFEEAVSLLKLGMSVTKVAEILGYKSIHIFSRAFANYHGMSPNKYKGKMIKKEGKQDEIE